MSTVHYLCSLSFVIINILSLANLAHCSNQNSKVIAASPPGLQRARSLGRIQRPLILKDLHDSESSTGNVSIELKDRNMPLVKCSGYGCRLCSYPASCFCLAMPGKDGEQPFISVSCIFWEDFVLSRSMLTNAPTTDAKDVLVRPLYDELLRDYEIPSSGLRIKRLRFHSAITTLKKPSFSEGVFDNFKSLEFAEFSGNFYPSYLPFQAVNCGIKHLLLIIESLSGLDKFPGRIISLPLLEVLVIRTTNQDLKLEPSSFGPLKNLKELHLEDVRLNKTQSTFHSLVFKKGKSMLMEMGLRELDVYYDRSAKPIRLSIGSFALWKGSLPLRNILAAFAFVFLFVLSQIRPPCMTSKWATLTMPFTMIQTLLPRHASTELRWRISILSLLFCAGIIVVNDRLDLSAAFSSKGSQSTHNPRINPSSTHVLSFMSQLSAAVFILLCIAALEALRFVRRRSSSQFWRENPDQGLRIDQLAVAQH